MGWYKAKCPQCWDPMPCSCAAGKERDATVLAGQRYADRRARDEQTQLLREQVDLLRRIADARQP